MVRPCRLYLQAERLHDNVLDVPERLGRHRQTGSQVIAIQAGDEIQADALGANRLALAVIGAASEIKFIHGANHSQGALTPLGLSLRQQPQVRDFGGREEDIPLRYGKCLDLGRRGQAAQRGGIGTLSHDPATLPTAHPSTDEC